MNSCGPAPARLPAEGSPHERLERELRTGDEARWRRASVVVPRRRALGSSPAVEIEEAPPSPPPPPRLLALNAAAGPAGPGGVFGELGTTRESSYSSRDRMLALRLQEEQVQAYRESLKAWEESWKPGPEPQRKNTKVRNNFFLP